MGGAFKVMGEQSSSGRGKPKASLPVIWVLTDKSRVRSIDGRSSTYLGPRRSVTMQGCERRGSSGVGGP